MFRATLDRIVCPGCAGKLTLETKETSADVRAGMLVCASCESDFPILAGVAILAMDWPTYLLEHVKGVSRTVSDAELPKEIRKAFAEAREEIETEHIEEDIEAERVNALYVATHWLGTRETPWWHPKVGTPSPYIDSMIRAHWDHGPLAVVADWIGKRGKPSVLEVGCGVGGLSARVGGPYLGIDQSFASVALARHLSFGAEYKGDVKIPGDLLSGAVSREVDIKPSVKADGRVDFIVGDLSAAPVKEGDWDCVVALNAMDMLEDPSVLPKMQAALLKKGGVAIQSCPYIWHEGVAANLRADTKEQDSARAARILFERENFKISQEIDHVPWVFFKHSRQVELYSVHVFEATLGG